MNTARRYAVRRQFFEIQRLGGKCDLCGFNDARGLRLDYQTDTGPRAALTYLEEGRLPKTPKRVLCGTCWLVARAIAQGRTEREAADKLPDYAKTQKRGRKPKISLESS